jgi:diguanylate cyclase (GGDEF)-like protein/PAS domain S-box-containing protein
MNPHQRVSYLRIYLSLLIASAVAALAWSGARLVAEPFAWRWLALAGIAALSGIYASVRLPEAKQVVTLADTFLFLTLLLCGPSAAAIVITVTVASQCLRAIKHWLVAAANAAVSCVSFFLASTLVTLIFGDLRLQSPGQDDFILYALALSVLTAIYGSASLFFLLVGTWLNAGKSIREGWREQYGQMLVMQFTALLVAGVAGKLTQDYGFWAVSLVMPMLAAVYLAYRPYLEAARRHTLELQRSEARFRSTFDHSAIGMGLVDVHGRWLRVNQSLCKMLGYSEQELKSMNFRTLIHRDDLPQALKYVNLLLEGRLPAFQMEKRYLHKNGAATWVLWSASLARESDAQARLIFQVQDITERQRAKEQLLRDAFHDGLTGLPNRALFMQHLKLTLEQVRRQEERPFAVLFLDLDRFKIINDSLGHMIGDQLLVGTARRLESCLRPGDRVARLGGDEFTLLIRNINDITDATQIAERIRQELTQPFNLDGQEVFTTVSIGIAHSAIGYEQPEDMLRDADTAMYRAKARGKARHEIFDKDMHSQTRSRLQIETDMRRAIENNEFCVHYQPIVTLETGRLQGFEALVRWEHPEQGLISPANFIPIAEDTGLIVDIGRQVLRESCRQMREWQLRYPHGFALQVSVNLSGKQFLQPDLIEQIKAILRETQLEPKHLKLEITETVVMENVEVATNMLRQIRALGIELSIDDFGTGYSSLSYLHRFPLNTLKVDRSFVTQMRGNNENTEIVRTIVTLARTLGMNVIAEGVETPEQLAQLRALDCKYGQGYFFSKPRPAKEAGKLVASGKQWPIGIHCQVLGEQQTSTQVVECTVVM